MLAMVVMCYGLGPMLITQIGGGWLLGSLAPWGMFSLMLALTPANRLHWRAWLHWLGLWSMASPVSTSVVRPVGFARAFGVLILGQALLMLVWAIISSDIQPTVHNPLEHLDDRQRGLFALMAVVGAPLFEELIFRGWIQQGLRCVGRSAGRRILLTSALFALLHHGGQGSWVPLVYVGLMALWLGWGREWSASLWPGILTHSLHNLLALILLWRQSS